MSTASQQRTLNTVETYSGKYVDVNSPQPESIDLKDIAHALANTCRYGGHCSFYYSVAEHAVFVSRRVERKGGNREQILAALHHDDAEAYLGDIPRPLKPLLGKAYERLSNKMDQAIIKSLELPFNDFHDPLVSEADKWSLFVEARHLLPSGGRDWILQPTESRVVIPDYWVGGMAPSRASEFFLRRHFDLLN